MICVWFNRGDEMRDVVRMMNRWFVEIVLRGMGCKVFRGQEGVRMMGGELRMPPGG